MSESISAWSLSTDRDFKVHRFQELYEKSGWLTESSKLVILPVESYYLNATVHTLKDLGVSSHVVGVDPITIAVSAEDAQRIPLFNPASEKHRQLLALVSSS
jgi:hypothetical protein